MRRGVGNTVSSEGRYNKTMTTAHESDGPQLTGRTGRGLYKYKMKPCSNLHNEHSLKPYSNLHNEHPRAQVICCQAVTNKKRAYRPRSESLPTQDKKKRNRSDFNYSASTPPLASSIHDSYPSPKIGEVAQNKVTNGIYETCEPNLLDYIPTDQYLVRDNVRPLNENVRCRLIQPDISEFSSREAEALLSLTLPDSIKDYTCREQLSNAASLPKIPSRAARYSECLHTLPDYISPLAVVKTIEPAQETWDINSTGYLHCESSSCEFGVRSPPKVKDNREDHMYLSRSTISTPFGWESRYKRARNDFSGSYICQVMR